MLVGIGIGLLGQMYAQRIGERIGNRDDQDAAEDGGDGLRARMQPGDQADGSNDARGRAEEEAGAGAVVAEEAHAAQFAKSMR